MSLLCRKVIFPYMGVCTLQGETVVKPVKSEQTLAIKFQSQGHVGCQRLMLREWGDRGLPHSVTSWNKFIPHTPAASLSVNTLVKLTLEGTQSLTLAFWYWDGRVMNTCEGHIVYVFTYLLSEQICMSVLMNDFSARAMKVKGKSNASRP